MLRAVDRQNAGGVGQPIGDVAVAMGDDLRHLDGRAQHQGRDRQVIAAHPRKRQERHRQQAAERDGVSFLVGEAEMAFRALERTQGQHHDSQRSGQQREARGGDEVDGLEHGTRPPEGRQGPNSEGRAIR